MIMALYLQLMLRAASTLFLLLGYITKVAQSFSFLPALVRAEWPPLHDSPQKTAADLGPVFVPSEHPVFIQFSEWLTAFNTADRQTLKAYHSGSKFPYSAALPPNGYAYL